MKLFHNIQAAYIAALFFALFPQLVSAQNIPSSAQPGIVIKGVEGKKRPQTRIDGELVKPEKAATGAEESGKKMFTLNRVIVEGSTVYKQEDIDVIVKDRIGKKASFGDLSSIADMITARYRQDGYILSKAILPPQKISDGTVKIKAVEGRITDVKLVGDFKDNNNLIHELADKIKSTGGPSNSREIERYLLLINDLPGITARSVIHPSKIPGGGELIITIEQKDFEGSVGIDSRGSEYLGPYRGTIVGAANSLFGIHDRTTLRGIMSSQKDEMKYGEITHEEQIGSEGVSIRGRFAANRTEPGEELKTLYNLKGKSDLYAIDVFYPLVRNREHNLSLSGGFTAVDSQTDILGSVNSKDRVRYLRGGTEFDFVDALAGVNQFNIEVAKGIDIFGATEDGAGRSRANGKHDFGRLNFSAERVQELWGAFSMQISGAGQYSVDPLLSSEEFTVGGPEYGRAYDSGEIAGDKGLSGAAELRYTPAPFADFITSQQIYVYYDAGKVWNISPVALEYSSAALASAGIGARFNFDGGVYFNLEFDNPLTRTVSSEHNKDNRLFFNILKRF